MMVKVTEPSYISGKRPAFCRSLSLGYAAVRLQGDAYRAYACIKLFHREATCTPLILTLCHGEMMAFD